MATELGRLVETLASQEQHLVRDALEAIERLLSSGAPSASDAPRLERAFARLVNHESSQVRKALACALDHFHHESFERLIGALAADSNAYVKTAAQKVLAHRTSWGRTDTLREGHDELLRSWLGDLEGRFGVQARDAASKVAYRFADLIVREADHELTKVVNVIGPAIGLVVEAHQKEPVDRNACRRPLELAENGAVLLKQILESIRGLMTDVTPSFRTERLTEVVAQAVTIAAGPNATGVFSVDLPSDIVVELDCSRMVLALSNVIKNALESYAGTDRERRVAIRGRLREDDHITITVTDSGCGMTPEQQRFRIFESSKPGGTGFGLPLARKVLESEHRGRITFRSQPGEGTTVTICLPRVQRVEPGA